MLEEIPTSGEGDMPGGPLRLGYEQAVAHVAQKLHLHDVNLLHGDTGDLGPSLVRVGVVVED